MNDDAIVNAVLAGDRALYGELVDRHGRRVYHVVYQKVADPHIAEDITQEAFLRGFERLRNLRSGERFSPWVLRIAANLAHDHLREQARHVRADDLLEHLSAAPEDDEPPAEGAVLQRLLSALPTDARVALTMRYVEGMEYEDMAEILGERVGTLQTRVCRALRRLRAAFQRELRREREDER